MTYDRVKGKRSTPQCDPRSSAKNFVCFFDSGGNQGGAYLSQLANLVPETTNSGETGSFGVFHRHVVHERVNLARQDAVVAVRAAERNV